MLVTISLSTQNQENDTLKQILEKYMDKPVKVSLYNSKTRTTRGGNCSWPTTAAPLIHYIADTTYPNIAFIVISMYALPNLAPLKI